MAVGMILIATVRGGDIEPSWGPQSGSGMYTLSDMYYYLTEGMEGSIRDNFQGPTAGPGSTMMNTKIIYDDVKSKLDRCGAGPGEVLSGATFFSTDTEAWGPQSGTVETLTLSPQTETVAVGFYEQTTLSGVDSDLAPGNIKQSVTVFGIAGDSNVSDTSSGDAVSGEIMSGKVAWVAGSEVTGDLATQTLSPANDMVTAGFYAQTTLSTVDGDLATGNIKSGETIFGISGDSNVVDTSSGDATAGEILATRKAYVDGSEVTGSIATQTLSPANDTVDAGYYAATTLSTVDADLATGNIKSGETIFGIAGDSNVVDTSSGDAVAGDILTGKKAYVAGSQVTGNVAAGSSVTGTDGDLEVAIQDGLYSGGDKTATATDSDLAVGNIKDGVEVFGTTGTFPSDGDALVDEVKTGKYFYTDSSTRLTGSGTKMLSVANDTVTAGFYEETTLSGVDSSLATGNIKQGIDIFGIAGDPNVADTGTLSSADEWSVFSDQVAWANGSMVTGRVETLTWTSNTTAYDAGYYAQTDLTSVDANLVTGNIKDGVTIFGVLGTYSGTGLPKTGQSTSDIDYDDAYYADPAGDDIGNPKGEGSWAAYTADGGRFTNNGDGTITDNATGLMWASDGIGEGCDWGSSTLWPSAIVWAKGLDFAGYTDWRLPNSQELYSIVDCSRTEPAIDTNYFPNTKWRYYWSSTTYAGGPEHALLVCFGYGGVKNNVKNGFTYVRAVRGGK